MKLKSILLALLIIVSTLLFGASNTLKAEAVNIYSNTQQDNSGARIEFKWINGALWIIIYDSDENIIHASAVGHGD